MTHRYRYSSTGKYTHLVDNEGRALCGITNAIWYPAPPFGTMGALPGCPECKLIGDIDDIDEADK